jgi:hypothetical protein
MPGDDVELQLLASFLRDARAMVNQGPDAETTARHLAAIKAMVGDADTIVAAPSAHAARRGSANLRRGSKVMSRKVLAIVGALLLVGLLSGAAYAGVLPNAVQRAVADVAGSLGVAIPGSTADDDSDVGEVDEAGDIEESEVDDIEEADSDDLEEGPAGQVEGTDDVDELGDVDDGEVEDTAETEAEDSDEGEVDDADEVGDVDDGDEEDTDESESEESDVHEDEDSDEDDEDDNDDSDD